MCELPYPHTHTPSAVSATDKACIAIGTGLLAAAAGVVVPVMATSDVLVTTVGLTLVVAWLSIWRPVRVAMLLILGGLGAGTLLLWRLARRRRHAPLPQPRPAGNQVATVRAWTVTLYEPRGERNAVVGRGVVEGAWRSSGEVEAEALQRAIAAFGYDRVGHMRAHAQLAVTR